MADHQPVKQRQAAPDVEQEIKYNQEVIHDTASEYEARIIIAERRPREFNKVLKKCLDEAELSGELFYYNWSVKSKQKDGNYRTEVIEGPSYYLAKSAARNFGNCDVGMLPVHDTYDAWIFTGRFIDFESNASITRQFRQDKTWVVYGRMDDSRKDDMRFQIGQSKCLRNVILAAIPETIIDKMFTVAKQSMRNKIDAKIEKAKSSGGIESVKKDILVAFEAYSISQWMIENKFEIPFKAWDAEFLTRLSGDLSALQHGTETTDTLYGEYGDTKSDRLNEKLKEKNGAAKTDETVAETVFRNEDESIMSEEHGKTEPETEAMMTDGQIRGLEWVVKQLQGKPYQDQTELENYMLRGSKKEMTFKEASAVIAKLNSRFKKYETKQKDKPDSKASAAGEN